MRRSIDSGQSRLGEPAYTEKVVIGFIMNIRRHRKQLASLLLGAWVFALFIGIANACLVTAPQPVQSDAQGIAMPGNTGHDGDQGPSANSLQFCADDTPLFSKLQLVQDQPAGQPLLVAGLAVSYAPTPADVVGVVHLAHPPPGVPVLLSTLRLAL
jgi:hypothetical protein